MVRFYYEHQQNISLTVRTFRCDSKTVRYWVNKLKKHKHQGPKDQRGKHVNRPHKTPERIVKLVVQLHQRSPHIGQNMFQWFLVQYYHIPLSTSTINRILHHHQLIKSRVKNWRQKINLTQLRKKLKALENFQIDVKYLDDIETL